MADNTIPKKTKKSDLRFYRPLRLPLLNGLWEGHKERYVEKTNEQLIKDAEFHYKGTGFVTTRQFDNYEDSLEHNLEHNKDQLPKKMYIGNTRKEKLINWFDKKAFKNVDRELITDFIIKEGLQALVAGIIGVSGYNYINKPIEEKYGVSLTEIATNPIGALENYEKELVANTKNKYKKSTYKKPIEKTEPETEQITEEKKPTKKTKPKRSSRRKKIKHKKSSVVKCNGFKDCHEKHHKIKDKSKKTRAKRIKDAAETNSEMGYSQ